MKTNIYISLLFVGLLFCGSLSSSQMDQSIEIQISGVDDEKIVSLLRNASKLQSQSSRAFVSKTALKRRAEVDVNNLVQALHSLAYYEARIDFEIEDSSQPVVVTYKVSSGPIYSLGSFNIHDISPEPHTFPFDKVRLKDLNIELGAPALPIVVLEAEELLLKHAAAQGYPQFCIKKRQTLADQQSKELLVTLEVDPGLLTAFGQTIIAGNGTVDESFIKNKISWKEGESFNLQDIAETQEALDKSGLFSSATITYQEPEPGSASLPIEIELTEAKHRTIAAGLSYTTQRGVGVTGEWEHRNVRGQGERVNIRGSLWKDTQEAKISYILPNFGCVDQNLLWQAGIEHEITEGYTEKSLFLSALLDKKFSPRMRFSYGVGYKSLVTSHSEKNGSFQLLQAPLHWRWSTANSLLDPTSGHTLSLKATPTLSIVNPYFAYCPTILTGTCYLPLNEDRSVVLAAKASVGSIIGGSNSVPSSERFYAGGEGTLRGYRYLTVSPLDSDNKPIGGNSLMTLSLEARMKITQDLSLVGFYEAGNVYKSTVPQFSGRQLHAVGLGVRYHTPVGPIRLDVAVPLNPRKGLDSSYQIYMSIGQSF